LYRIKYINYMDISEILDKLYIQRTTLLKQLEAVNNAIIGFGGRLPSSTAVTSLLSTNLSVSTLPDYPSKGTNEEKIKYILGKIGKSTATRIAEFIQQAEQVPDDKSDKLHGIITMVASSMYTSGKIKAEKDGKRNLYFL